MNLEEEVSEGDVAVVTLPYDIKLPWPWGSCKGQVSIYIYFKEIGYETANIIVSLPEEE
jgi:hypothetical protein